RRTFRFQAEVARARLAVLAAGDLFAVDPQPDLAVDRPDVVVVPLVDALAEVLPREAALAVGRRRRQRRHFRLADVEHVAVAGGVLRLFPLLFLVLLDVAVVEDLHLDAGPRQLAGR